MYATGNPPTKKALKAMVDAGMRGDGHPVTIFSPGPFPAPQQGQAFVEGPHYPQPHRWYAEVYVTNGVITRVVR